MRKESAIKYINNHIKGNKNIVSEKILKDITKSIMNSGGIPPFKIVKIGQLAEDIEEIVDYNPQMEENNSEDQITGDSSENHPSEDEVYFSLPGPAIYSLKTGDFVLINMEDSVFTDILLSPRNDQIELLKQCVDVDGSTINGEAILISVENNTTGENIPQEYDGLVIFNPFLRNKARINENIYGYYSM